MKLLFIAANKDHSESFTTKIVYKLNSSPMLVLQQLAAIPPEHSVQLIDDRYDYPEYDSDADIIGISTLTPSAPRTYHISTYRQLIKKIHNYNMIVYGSFVFGFDHDTPDIFDTTLQTIYDYGIDAAEFDILTTYPITRLYKQLEHENRILHHNWLKHNLHHVVFKPKHLTPQDLQQGAQSISTQFHSPIKTIQRSIGSIINTKTILTTLASAATNVSMKRFHKEYTYITHSEEANT